MINLAYLPQRQSKLSLSYPSTHRNWSWAQSLSVFHTGLGDKLARNNPKELQNYSLYGRYLWKLRSATDFGSCEENLSHFSTPSFSSQYSDFEGVQLSWHHYTPWKFEALRQGLHLYHFCSSPSMTIIRKKPHKQSKITDSCQLNKYFKKQLTSKPTQQEGNVCSDMLQLQWRGGNN